MELDKRIKEGKRPLTCIDVEQAREFEGKQCLFSDLYANYKNIREYAKYPQYTGVLHIGEEKQLLHSKEDYIFRNLTDGYCYSLVLPLEWVKPEEPEKKYRPYTMNEFKAEFKIGMVLTLKNRDTPDYVCQVMYLGNRQYDESDSNNNTIFLSQRFFSLRELFNMFEIVRNGEWQPFGIEVEEK